MINSTNWKALVIRQTRPGMWLIGATDQPKRDAIFTGDRTIFISKAEDRNKGKGKGRGKTGKNGWPTGQSSTSWRPPPPTTAPGPPSAAGPIQNTITITEDKIHDKLKEMQQEALTTHQILEADLEQHKQTADARHEQQEQTNRGVQERFKTMESSFSASLNSCVEVLRQSLLSQREDLKNDMKKNGENLKAELTDEVRAQLSMVRKRTPSPTRMEEDKKQKN
jgi:hypothetical protein